jgi:pimeloyl-ACP methyl ester carboxylesterase
MSVIIVEQEIIHYEVLGRGRPLIFLHGWVGSWRYWISAMQAACTGYRTYALDLWGFGDTAKNRKYALSQQVELLDTFLDQMGIGKVALIGHGLGALVACAYAQQHSGVVDRVLAVSYPWEEAGLSPRLRTQSPPDLAEWLLGRNGLAEPVLSEAPKTDAYALEVSLRALADPQISGLLSRLSPACLLVHGATDPVVLCPRLEQVQELPAQSHAMVFEGSAHFPMLDESSKFNRLLLDFLSLPSGESPRVLQLKEEWKRRVR